MPLDFAGDAAPLLPASLTLAAPGHACGDADRGTVPDSVPFTVALADIAGALGPGDDAAPAGFAGPIALRDTVSAIYRRAAPGGSGTGAVAIPKGTDPDNKTALTTLAKQLYTDLCSWRLPRFDRAYVGSIAIPPDPLIGEVEFGYDGHSGAWTRVRSAPPGDEPTEFNHADPADCPECLLVYGPPAPATFAHPEVLPASTTEATTRLFKWEWCLKNGRQTLEPAGSDAFDGCCDQACRVNLEFIAYFAWYGGTHTIHVAYSGNLGDQAFQGQFDQLYSTEGPDNNRNVFNYMNPIEVAQLPMPSGPVVYGQMTATLTEPSTGRAVTKFTYHFCCTCARNGHAATTGGNITTIVDDYDTTGYAANSGETVAQVNCPEGGVNPYGPYGPYAATASPAAGTAMAMAGVAPRPATPARELILHDDADGADPLDLARELA